MMNELTAIDWPEAAQAGAKASVLAEDLQIDGEVSSAGPIEISGRITGSVRAPEVTVGLTGRVEGLVAALNLSVLGCVEGEIAAKVVVLKASAQVQADVTHELVTIEAGARIDGKFRRK